MKTYLLFVFMAFISVTCFSKSGDSTFEIKLENKVQLIFDDTIDSIDITLDTTSVEVFPDPAHDTLCVKYTLVNKGHVSVKIYELTGILADVLFEGTQAKGAQLIEYRTTPLKNGIYVIEIVAEADEGSKRVTIQK